MKRRLRDLPPALAMLVPSMALLGVWTVYPLVKAIRTGHLDCNLTATKCRDVGWDRYVDVFTSRQFQDALMVSVKFAPCSVSITLAESVVPAVVIAQARSFIAS